MNLSLFSGLPTLLFICVLTYLTTPETSHERQVRSTTSASTAWEYTYDSTDCSGSPRTMAYFALESMFTSTCSPTQCQASNGTSSMVICAGTTLTNYTGSYIMVEGYTDSACASLVTTGYVLADGKCHSSSPSSSTATTSAYNLYQTADCTGATSSMKVPGTCQPLQEGGATLYFTSKVASGATRIGMAGLIVAILIALL